MILVRIYLKRKSILLIEKGIDVNSQDKFGRTSLMVVIIHHRNSKEMVSYLINNGADTNIETTAGVSIIMPLEE